MIITLKNVKYFLVKHKSRKCTWAFKKENLKKAELFVKYSTWQTKNIQLFLFCGPTVDWK